MSHKPTCLYTTGAHKIPKIKTLFAKINIVVFFLSPEYC